MSRRAGVYRITFRDETQENFNRALKAMDYTTVYNDSPHLEIILEECDDIYELSKMNDCNIEKVSITLCPNVVNLYGLRQIKDITLSHCDGITNLEEIMSIVQKLTIISLSGVKGNSWTGLDLAGELHIERCDIGTDLSIFARAQTLTLDRCNLNYDTSLDVSSLGSVQCLTIIHFSGLIGLGKLESVYTLKLVRTTPLMEYRKLWDIIVTSKEDSKMPNKRKAKVKTINQKKPKSKGEQAAI
jgi:hypothetical protein